MPAVSDPALDAPLLTLWPATIRIGSGTLVRRAKVFIWADRALVYVVSGREPTLERTAGVAEYRPSSQTVPSAQRPAEITTDTGERWVMFKGGCACGGGALASFSPAGPERSGT